MKYICILLCTLFVQLSYSIEIHQHWIHNDIQEQLKTSDYKLISVEHLIKKRSINELSIKVKLNGKDKEFVLQSAKGYFAGKDTRVWEAEKIGDNFKYTLKEGIMEKVNITFYQDEKTKSVVSHTVNKRGISEFNGIINSNVIIHPISHLIRRRRDAKPYSEYKNDIDNYHVIFNRDFDSFFDNYINKQKFNDFAHIFNNYYDNKKESNKIPENLHSEAPDIVYPEILVFVDTTLYERFQMDIEKTVAYILTLFNGADLNYRDMKKPLVRLNIAGIVLCRNQTVPNEPFNINNDASILFSKFMYNENEFKLGKDYDVAVLLGSNLKFFYGISGTATEGGACSKDTNEKIISSTLIMLDNTQFSGVIGATHELAHLFGTPHDGDRADQNFLGEGAEACPEDEGYMMSTVTGGKYQFHFSSCSKKIMSHFFSQKSAKCLLNNPADHRYDEQMLRILPGKLSSIDEQCQAKGFLKAAIVTPNICSGIKCIDNHNSSYTINVYAIEGTPCDWNKFCLRGECVDVPFDETYKNLGLNIYFPPYLQLPGTNKSAEEQCKEAGITYYNEAYFEGCDCLCRSIYSLRILTTTIPAQNGTLCNNTGLCFDGKCVDNSNVTDNKNSFNTTFRNVTNSNNAPPSLENVTPSIDDTTNSDSITSSTDDTGTILQSFDDTTNSDSVTTSTDNTSMILTTTVSSLDNTTIPLELTTPRDLITNVDSSDNKTISNDIDDFEESTTPESILDFNDITTPQSGTTFDTSDPMEQELQIMNEQCERAEEGYFFTLLPNKCFVACTLDKYLAYHPDKDNDETYQVIRNDYLFYQDYKEVVVQDGFKCKDNGYCQGGQCVEQTTTDSNTSSTDSTDSVKESTTPKSVEISIDYISHSTDGVTSSLELTTNRNLITNVDSSDNKTISNDFDDYEKSTTPERISDFNYVTTPQSVTSIDILDPVDKELQIMNEQCERAEEGYFFTLLLNKCFIACTLDKYLAYHPDKDNDDTYQAIRNNYVFYQDYKEVVVQDGFKCKDNGYCRSGQCVEMTDYGTIDKMILSSLESDDFKRRN